ncbi:MAG: hypothetical protein IKP97_05610, partial [Kiritimatiellae bacterium]|nr:hypothetical protein [Kiritimatiellia bacterium]
YSLVAPNDMFIPPLYSFFSLVSIHLTNKLAPPLPVFANGVFYYNELRAISFSFSLLTFEGKI